MTAALATRRAYLLAERALVDDNGGGAWHLHSGTMPASPETPPAAPPLAIVALPVPAYTVHATLAQMTATAQGFAALAGQVTWARLVDGVGNPVRDCTAGPPGSMVQVIVTDGKEPPTAQVFAGGEVNIAVTIAF